MLDVIDLQRSVNLSLPSQVTESKYSRIGSHVGVKLLNRTVSKMSRESFGNIFLPLIKIVFRQFNGARGRIRTVMALRPRDFKSPVSTVPPHPHDAIIQN